MLFLSLCVGLIGGNLRDAAAFEKVVNDLREVLHGRADDNGFGVDRRFHDALPAVRNERAADKDDSGELVGRGEFAQRVQDQDIGIRITGGRVGAALDAPAAALGQLRDRGEAFRVARDKQQARLF